MPRRAPAAAVPVTALAAALALTAGCSAGQAPASAPAPATVARSAGSAAAAPRASDTAVPTLSPPAPAGPSAPTTPGPAADPSPAGTVIDVSYAAGKVAGDTGRVRVRSGEPVSLRVTSDVPEQVHVHGVDLYVDLAAGRTATARFTAPPPGVYELELHDAGTVLTRMQVT